MRRFGIHHCNETHIHSRNWSKPALAFFRNFLMDWIIDGYCYITLWNTCIGIWWILNSMKRMVTLDSKFESGDGVILKIFALSGQSIRNFQQMWARLCSRAWPQTQKWKKSNYFFSGQNAFRIFFCSDRSSLLDDVLLYIQRPFLNIHSDRWCHKSHFKLCI